MATESEQRAHPDSETAVSLWRHYYHKKMSFKMICTFFWTDINLKYDATYERILTIIMMEWWLSNFISIKKKINKIDTSFFRHTLSSQWVHF